jgi:uncharacterized protein
MSNSQQPAVGTIGWVDLTVEHADEVRDFYREVAGWTVTECAMGDYSDYVMSSPATGAPVAGVCHARGVNAGIPPAWLMYIVVEDLDASLARSSELGGEAVGDTRDMGGSGRYRLVRDPAGAFVMLYQATGGSQE